MAQIFVGHIAREARLSERTVRRYLQPEFPPHQPGAWLRFDEERLPELVELVKSKQKRRGYLNRFNSVPIPIEPSASTSKESKCPQQQG